LRRNLRISAKRAKPTFTSKNEKSSPWILRRRANAVMVAAVPPGVWLGLNDYGPAGCWQQGRPHAKPSGPNKERQSCESCLRAQRHTLVLADERHCLWLRKNSDGQNHWRRSRLHARGELLAWATTLKLLVQEDAGPCGAARPMPVTCQAEWGRVCRQLPLRLLLTDRRLYALRARRSAASWGSATPTTEFLFSPQPVPCPGRVQMCTVSAAAASPAGLGTRCHLRADCESLSDWEKDSKVACVAAGSGTRCGVCSRTGQLYAFGDPQHGKLGFKARDLRRRGRRQSILFLSFWRLPVRAHAGDRPAPDQRPAVVCGTPPDRRACRAAKDAGGGSGRSSSLARPARAATRGRRQAAGAARPSELPSAGGAASRSSTITIAASGTSASLADRRVGGGRLAPLSLNGAERPAPSGSLWIGAADSRRWRCGAAQVRVWLGVSVGVAGQGYGSDSDALKPSKRDGDLAGSSRRPETPQQQPSAASPRVGWVATNRRRLQAARRRSGGRGGSKPLKPIGTRIEDEENSDKDFGRGRAAEAAAKTAQQDQRRPRQVDRKDGAATSRERPAGLTRPRDGRRCQRRQERLVGGGQQEKATAVWLQGIGCGRGGKVGRRMAKPDRARSL
uniref:Regulator of chromosome condensation (RCC1) repeat-containing protein n=1 Tax=Macrostomum lignano TaxID=282301 RepID=A0A1I8FMT9_9PLAT